jgi:hypothetical protein
MHQQQLNQEPELRDTVIACPSSLQSFFSSYADPDMRLLDHCDIIRTVTNC